MIGRIALVVVAIFMVWLAIPIAFRPELMVPSATVDVTIAEEAQLLEQNPAPRGIVPTLMRFASAGLLIFFGATLLRMAWKGRKPRESVNPSE